MNQGPPPGFHPPAPGFNGQPIYPNINPQQQPFCPYPAPQAEFQSPSYPVGPPTAPPPYNPEYSQPTQVPVVTRVVLPANFGPESTRLICPHCQADISTKVEIEPSTKTHICAMILCLLGLCICIPCVYCGDCFTTAKHSCPSCNSYLGTYEP